MKKQNLIDKAFLLKSTTVFESLDLDLLLAFADKLTVIGCEKGKTIFPVGQEAHRMYFIVRGAVTIFDEVGGRLAYLASPDFFGDESLFSGLPRGYGAISETETLLFALSRTHLFMMISEAPSVALGFLREYASSLCWRKGGREEK